ncbi:MAG: CDP-diacylglycerol--serine O-phosphatidyltransferase [Nitrospiraceae bacterium]|nr:CDP-diacylglycerol--serine O-phosphatidyltransferase [Nitrospiraceae bacterium]
MKTLRKRKTKKSTNRRRPINVLASLLTTISLYLGLSSIFASIQQNYEAAAYFILGAIICDMLDGTVARMTHSISEFGKELDSLCDLVSFGVAPAVLIYHAYLYEEQQMGSAVGRAGSVVAICFVICAALRLARFNVYQSDRRDSFTGLPVPAAGGTVASFVLFMEYFELNVAYYVLGPLTIALAALMVSNVHYPKDKMKKVFVQAPAHGFRMLAMFVVVIAVFHYAITHHPVIVLLPLALAYVLFGVVDESLVWLKARRKALAQSSSGESSSGPSVSKSGERL